MNTIPLLLLLHVLGATIWVGGMFFAYVCLRPVAAAQLAPPQRLPLWHAVLRRFFLWVWIAVPLLLVSGLAMLLAIGFGNAPLHWHLMLLSGCLMIAIYLWVYFRPFAALRCAVEAQQWDAGGRALARIRRLVGVNLALGLLTITLATAGRLIA